MVSDKRARFRDLVEPVHARACAFARCLCRSNAEGDDLFQDSLLRAFTKLDLLRDDQAFRPWLYRIVIRVHRSRARRDFWRRLVPFREPEEAAGAADEAFRATAWTPGMSDASRRARAALSQLPAEQREVIVLFEIDEWKVDEIAALLGVSASAIKSRLARGRARLRALYDQQPSLTTALDDRAPGDLS